MKLDKILKQADEIIINQGGDLLGSFLNIGLIRYNNYKKLVKGPLIKLIKLFDKSKPFLEELGLTEKSKEGVVYITKSIDSQYTKSIMNKIRSMNKINNIEVKCFSQDCYVFTVPFDFRREKFMRFDFEFYGGITKEELQKELKSIKFNYLDRVPSFEKFIEPYVSKPKPVPKVS